MKNLKKQFLLFLLALSPLFAYGQEEKKTDSLSVKSPLVDVAALVKQVLG